MSPLSKAARSGTELILLLLNQLEEPNPSRAVGDALLNALAVTRGAVATFDVRGRSGSTILTLRGEVPGDLFLSSSPSSDLILLGARPRVAVWSPDIEPIVLSARLAPIEAEISAIVRTALRMESVEHARREKEEFTSFLLHDLRNPLTVALTNLEFIREAALVRDAESVAALLDTQESVSLVVDHLGGLLDIAQLEESGLVCRREPLRVTDLLKAVVEQFQFSARRRGIRLSLESEVTGIQHLDRDLLRRMIHNLLTTSLRVAPVGGWVEVRARNHGAGLRLVVASSAPPVAEELRPSLFTKYRRLGAGGRSDTHAHGLGLYFVRLAAEAHGGSVRAEGHPDGSAFIVEFPDARHQS